MCGKSKDFPVKTILTYGSMYYPLPRWGMLLNIFIFFQKHIPIHVLQLNTWIQVEIDAKNTAKTNLLCTGGLTDNLSNAKLKHMEFRKNSNISQMTF